MLHPARVVVVSVPSGLTCEVCVATVKLKELEARARDVQVLSSLSPLFLPAPPSYLSISLSLSLARSLSPAHGAGGALLINRPMRARQLLKYSRPRHEQMLKFGQEVDLEVLEKMSVNKTAEDLKEQLKKLESKNAAELKAWQKKIEEAAAELAAVRAWAWVGPGPGPGLGLGAWDVGGAWGVGRGGRAQRV